MAYEVNNHNTDTEEHLLERLNEFLIDNQGINTDDFTVKADGEGNINIALEEDMENVWEQMANNSAWIAAEGDKE